MAADGYDEFFEGAAETAASARAVWEAQQDGSGSPMAKRDEAADQSVDQGNSSFDGPKAKLYK